MTISTRALRNIKLRDDGKVVRDTDKLRLRPAALPSAGISMIFCAAFPNVKFPASYCTKQAVGAAIREGRMV